MCVRRGGWVVANFSDVPSDFKFSYYYWRPTEVFYFNFGCRHERRGQPTIVIKISVRINFDGSEYKPAFHISGPLSRTSGVFSPVRGPPCKNGGDEDKYEASTTEHQLPPSIVCRIFRPARGAGLLAQLYITILLYGVGLCLAFASGWNYPERPKQSIALGIAGAIIFFMFPAGALWCAYH